MEIKYIIAIVTATIAALGAIIAAFVSKKSKQPSNRVDVNAQKSHGAQVNINQQGEQKNDQSS